MQAINMTEQSHPNEESHEKLRISTYTMDSTKADMQTAFSHELFGLNLLANDMASKQNIGRKSDLKCQMKSFSVCRYSFSRNPTEWSAAEVS